MLLVDSDVLVDFLRFHEPAVEWFKSIAEDEIGLPGFVAMELIQGCKNQHELRRVQKQVANMTLVWPTQADCTRAYQNFSDYWLSHSLGFVDALIAQTAVGANLTIATFNVKHYRVIENSRTVQPYER